MPDLLARTIAALRIGAEPIDIHTMLKATGLTDYQAWLTFVGARLIVQNDP